MNAFNLYEAYAAVYDEDLREDLLAVEEDFSFVDDLSDNELVQIMEEILSENEVTLDECLQFFDAEILSEETEMERMNRLMNKRTREKKAAKSAERERVGRKHAIKRLQVAATRAGRNLADKAKAAGTKVKTLGGELAHGAAEAGRAAKGAASAAKEKVTGKLASAKEKIKGLIKSGRKAVAGGLRGLAAKVEPKEKTGKEIKDAAKSAVSSGRKPAPYRMVGKAGSTRVASGSRTPLALPPVGKTKSGKDLTPQQRGMQTAAQNVRLQRRLGEDLELFALQLLEDLIKEGYAETFEGALNVLETFSDYEVGEIAENYLAEETETVDLYDVILEHLLDEGYADTEEAATVIMANMSEEWRQEILKNL